ncbi:MAG TPA: single-stranded-DNA-specific exonuclease RecJ [Gammaproteobacteria bacterium]|nr:single-stranded-DNA-specific exonuclease RecJ [Gammaproteobacteria bacterium]|tara:strand:+ start:1392 stop:3125 length:1734 start_codon:yes stop_codon:yes gene_type:complete
MTRLQRRNPDEGLILPAEMHPLLQRVYRQRSLTGEQELDLALANLIPPHKMLGMAAAVDLLIDALDHQRRVLIVSDFDADGATSCALAICALQEFGFRHVEYIVPNRFDFGYGLTPKIVDELAKEKEPDLIITVDNGISSVAGVKAAKQIDCQVLITDHHLAPEKLPEADAIVNPNQQGCFFKSKAIAGVGVIFYVMLALRGRMRELGRFGSTRPEPNMAALLDLIALGTIADVVPLDHNNRILVAEGLRRIRAGKARPGIHALLQVAGKNTAALTASDLAFGVGPRLNAAGRLDDMATGIECLLSEHADTAYKLALQLDAMNQDRKQIESDMRQQAFESLAQFDANESDLPSAFCLFDQRWHQGVVGILASRIKEKYHRPVIAFAMVEEGKELKGSARSIGGFHIRDALDAVATKNPELVTNFGGHAMAAGLSLAPDKLDAFRLAFEEEARLRLSRSQLKAVIESDGEVAADDLTLETAQLIQSAGPWGQAFPEPQFDGHFILRDQRRLGGKHLKMVLSPECEPDKIVDAIAFNVADEMWPASQATKIELVYRLAVNDFRNSLNLQLLVENILGSQ